MPGFDTLAIAPVLCFDDIWVKNVLINTIHNKTQVYKTPVIWNLVDLFLKKKYLFAYLFVYHRTMENLFLE